MQNIPGSQKDLEDFHNLNMAKSISVKELKLSNLEIDNISGSKMPTVGNVKAVVLSR